MAMVDILARDDDPHPNRVVAFLGACILSEDTKIQGAWSRQSNHHSIAGPIGMDLSCAPDDNVGVHGREAFALVNSSFHNAARNDIWAGGIECRSTKVPKGIRELERFDLVRVQPHRNGRRRETEGRITVYR
jgi:hypothetical protein